MARDRLKGRKTLKVTGFLEEFEKDAIKDKVDIVALFAEFGINLTKKGKSYTGLCPWHDDKKPSLSVDREKGLYNCFGCGESGDVFSLVQKIKGYDFKQALKFLQERAGSVAAPAVVEKKPAQKLVTDLNLNTINEYYHKKLYENKQALNYLERRGLKNPELLGRFKLGYADGSLLKISSNGQREALKLLGLINEKNNEHFYNCITFPITGNNDQVLSLYGRSIEGSLHLYLAGKHKSVFNRKAGKVYDEIILTESIIDALSLIQLGVQNVQACYGTNGFTDEHLQILKDDRVKTMVIGFDNDQAGRTAAEKLKDRLIKEDFAVKVLYPPAGKDWNEYLLKGGTGKELKELIDQAQLMRRQTQTREMQATKQGPKHYFRFEHLSYRLLGVKEVFISSLRVNIKAEYNRESYYDNLDLYSARSRSNYAHNLGQLFNLEPKSIENHLINMLEHLEAERDRALSAYEEKEEKELTAEEREMGLKLLTDPKIFQTIVDDMQTLGYAGEEINKQLIYLAATSRKLDDPISVLVLSESATGKSFLTEIVRQLMPREDVVCMTSLSDQALNYLPEAGLMHKFLIMGEAVHGEVVEHQIREMLSSKELSRLVTVKDEKTGELVSKTIKKKVVVSAVMSSTNYELNAENLSRCFVINTDETIEQTRRIHALQKNKYSIKRYYEKKQVIPGIIKKHRCAQRLLKNRVIVNPFAQAMDFPDSLLRARRDHERFMDLLACVCFLRQYQKKTKQLEDGTEYIECDLDDYETAFKIIKGVLPATLANFPKSGFLLYEELRKIARSRAKKQRIKVEQVGLTQREVREQAGFNQRFIKRYMRVLCDYEFLKKAGLNRRGGRNTYYLIKDEPLELVDISRLPSPEEMRLKLQEL